MSVQSDWKRALVEEIAKFNLPHKVIGFSGISCFQLDLKA